MTSVLDWWRLDEPGLFFLAQVALQVNLWRPRASLQRILGTLLATTFLALIFVVYLNIGSTIQTPVLVSFGVPEERDVHEPSRLFQTLQISHAALVETKRTLYSLGQLLVQYLMGVCFTISRALLVMRRSKEIEAKIEG